jgi:hypothetical protein
MIMEAAGAIGIAILVLVAVLTGALLPLLFQARATLRSAQIVLDEGRPMLLRTLDELQHATREAREVIAEVQASEPRAAAFMESVAGLTATLNQVQASMRSASAIGTAIGPAVVAAVQAFRAIRAEDSANAEESAELATAKPTARAGHHRLTPIGADEQRRPTAM